MLTTINGLKIDYSQKGNGEDLLLLHGWGGSIESLAPLQEELSKFYKVTNISLPGFGESEAPEKAWELKDYALFLEDLILKLKLKRPTVVAHSFGGKISIKFALEFPELISRLVLVAASGIKPKNSVKKFIFGAAAKTFGLLTSLLPKKSKEKAKEFFYKYIVRERDYLNAGALKETFKKIVNEHFDQELTQIKVPTFIIWGEKDTYVPIWMGVRMRTLIPNSRLEMIEGETHGLPIHNPKLVAKLILN